MDCVGNGATIGFYAKVWPIRFHLVICDVFTEEVPQVEG